MENVVLFELEKIPDSSNIFSLLREKQIFFSYFQVDQKYYLLIFSQQYFDKDFVYKSKSLNSIKELDTKERKLRSYRGFFLYALEIMEEGNFCAVIETNLKAYFWTKVKNIMGQNKKGNLLEFLFENSPNLIDLQNQLNFLQERVTQLEQNQKFISSNFKSLREISEEEISQVFKLCHESNLPLKEFFEGTSSQSLSQLKGYRLNYQNVKRTQIFKQFQKQE